MIQCECLKQKKITLVHIIIKIKSFLFQYQRESLIALKRFEFQKPQDKKNSQKGCNQESV